MSDLRQPLVEGSALELADINTGEYVRFFSINLLVALLFLSYLLTPPLSQLPSMANRWSNDANQGSAFHKLVVLPTLAPHLARLYHPPGTLAHAAARAELAGPSAQGASYIFIFLASG